MHKLIVLYPEPADRATFKDYYVRCHLPLAAQLPGVKFGSYSFEVAGLDTPYFAVFEAEFESREDMVSAMASAQGQTLQKDVSNYATGGATILDYPAEPFIE